MAMTSKTVRAKVGITYLTKIKAPHHLSAETFVKSVRYLLRPLKTLPADTTTNVTKLNLTASEPMTFVYWKVGHKDAFDPMKSTVKSLTYRYSAGDNQRSRIFPYPWTFFPNITSICFMGVNMQRMVEFFEINRTSLDKIKILDIGYSSPFPLYKRIGALTHRPHKIVISFMSKMREACGWAHGVTSLKIKCWNEKSNIFRRIANSKYSLDTLVDMLEKSTGLAAPQIQLDGMPILAAVMNAFCWIERDPVLLESAYRRTVPRDIPLARQLAILMMCSEHPSTRGPRHYRAYPVEVRAWLTSKMDAISAEGHLGTLLIFCAKLYIQRSDEDRTADEAIVEKLLDMYPRDLLRHIRWARTQLFPLAPSTPMMHLNALQKLGFDPLLSFICVPGVSKCDDAALNESTYAAFLSHVASCEDVPTLILALDLFPSPHNTSGRNFDYLFGPDAYSALLKRLTVLAPRKYVSLLISSPLCKNMGIDSELLFQSSFEEKDRLRHGTPSTTETLRSITDNGDAERETLDAIHIGLKSGLITADKALNLFLAHGNVTNSHVWTRILRSIGDSRISYPILEKIKATFCGKTDSQKQSLLVYFPGLIHLSCFMREFETFFRGLKPAEKVNFNFKDIAAGLPVSDVHELISRNPYSACAVLFEFPTIEPSFIHLEYVCKTYLLTYVDAWTKHGAFQMNNLIVVMTEIERVFAKFRDVEFPQSIQLVSLWMRVFGDGNKALWSDATPSDWWLRSPLARESSHNPFKNLGLSRDLSWLKPALQQFDDGQLPHSISAMIPDSVFTPAFVDRCLSFGLERFIKTELGRRNLPLPTTGSPSN
jgi:hypothetical protein